MAVPTCADLHLVPAPRECTAVETIPIGGVGFFVAAANDEDGFAAADLTNKDWGKRAVQKDAPFIRLERADTDRAKSLLGRHHLQFDAAMHDEGYVILPDGQGGLAVIAETSAGIFYGVQTVKQLIRGSGKDAVAAGAHPARLAGDGASRAVRRLVARAAAQHGFSQARNSHSGGLQTKYFSPYFEHTFAYASTPVAAFPGGSMTPSEAQELVAYAAQFHITVIPEQEAFGHLHNVLKFEQFSRLGETPHGAVLAPGDPGTLPQIGELVWRTGAGFSGAVCAYRRR